MRKATILGSVFFAFIFLSASAVGFQLGPPGSVQSESEEIVVLGYSVPAYVDWNNDSLADLIVGEGGSGYPGKVRIYLNVGSAAEPAFEGFFYAQSNGYDLIVPSIGCQGAFPRVVYWDADARKDMLVGQADGRVRLFLNTGTDDLPLFDGGTLLQVGQPGSEIDIDVGDRATPVVIDWDNDGHKDLVAGALDGYIRVYLNQGTGTEPIFLAEAMVQDSGAPLVVSTLRSSPSIGDVTNDGGKDLVVGETGGCLLLYENTGSDDDPSFQGPVAVTSDGVPIDLESSRSRPSLCDWNSDGVKDVVIGSSDGTVRLYLNLLLFADGFDSGTTEAWAIVVP